MLEQKTENKYHIALGFVFEGWQCLVTNIILEVLKSVCQVNIEMKKKLSNYKKVYKSSLLIENKISIPSIQFYGAMLKRWTEIIKAHIYFLLGYQTPIHLMF